MAQIDALLEQTVSNLECFIALIGAERQMLASGEIDQLVKLAGEKSALAARLATLDAQRDTALADSGLETGQAGIEAWLAARPAAAAIPARNIWQRLMTLAAEAKRENDINGNLISVRLQQNQQALSVLLGEAADATTYGPDGQQKNISGRRPLGSA
ncbi:MAG: flagellar protein FlgN [Rugosibacter sp.]|nr:flagellar protein FlgN [Rugosibacter sp.]